MNPETSSHPTAASLDTLRDIRSIMDRSARFISLSGWSGVWAGVTALVGALIAWYWLPESLLRYNSTHWPEANYTAPFCFCGAAFYKPLLLAIVVFLVALAGGYYFTRRKAQKDGTKLWSPASRQLVLPRS